MLLLCLDDDLFKEELFFGLTCVFLLTFINLCACASFPLALLGS